MRVAVLNATEPYFLSSQPVKRRYLTPASAEPTFVAVVVPLDEMLSPKIAGQ